MVSQLTWTQLYWIVDDDDDDEGQIPHLYSDVQQLVKRHPELPAGEWIELVMKRQVRNVRQ